MDAAIATNAVLNVVYPHMCGIGGDAFWLIYDAEKKDLVFLNASGRSPYGANIDYFSRLVFLVVVKMQVVWSNKSSLASSIPLCSEPAIGCEPT